MLKILVLDVNELKQIVDDVMRYIMILREATKKMNLSNFSLNSLCPWLQRYHWCGEEVHIEVPGQYTSDNKRSIQNHVKIVKFSENIQVFVSLRNPIRFKIHGSNGKSFEFLIKYSEDLRQDQRIQQLLGLMSKQLANDRNCQTYNLAIDTYTVLPINSYCGLLSWVPATQSLKDLLVESKQREDPNFLTKLNVLRDDHTKFVMLPSKNIKSNQSNLSWYGHAAATYSREQVNISFLFNDIWHNS